MSSLCDEKKHSEMEDREMLKLIPPVDTSLHLETSARRL